MGSAAPSQDVSRRTFGQTDLVNRRYASPVRQQRAAKSEGVLIEAAMIEMRAGNFRPCAKVIAARAGYDQARINERFGSVELMRRRLAREHWQIIAPLAGLAHLEEREQRRLVWLILTGAQEPDLTLHVPLPRSGERQGEGVAGARASHPHLTSPSREGEEHEGRAAP